MNFRLIWPIFIFIIINFSYQNCSKFSTTEVYSDLSKNENLNIEGAGFDNSNIEDVSTDPSSTQVKYDQEECSSAESSDKIWNYDTAHVESFSLAPFSSIAYLFDIPISEKHLFSMDSFPYHGFYFSNAVGGSVPILSRCPHSTIPVCNGKDTYIYEGSGGKSLDYSGLCVLKQKAPNGVPIKYYLNFIEATGRESGGQVQIKIVSMKSPRVCPKEYLSRIMSCPQ